MVNVLFFYRFIWLMCGKSFFRRDGYEQSCTFEKLFRIYCIYGMFLMELCVFTGGYCFFSVKQKDKWVLFLSWSAGYDACHRLYCNEYVHFGYAFLCKKNRILLCGKPLGRILNTSEFRKNTVINNEGLFNVS